ncbi:MAG: hypothetical protein EOM20_09350 [Spartobacteria bacterium]|nr:hypothetical protein [Spartobacteria bacterium]
MARKYNVPGTKKYLITAVVMLVLCIWAVLDGWFPSEKVLERHPDPTDGFYLFNKSLAIIMLVGMVVFGYIHFMVN